MRSKKIISIEDISNVDMKSVSRIAKDAKLEKIHLTKANIKSDPLIREPRGALLKYKYESKILPQEKGNILAVLCNFLVAAYRKEAPEKMLMSIEVTFMARYAFESIDNYKKVDLDNFSKINPLYNIWPFWREIVHNFTTRMGFPALTVPLLKIDFEEKTQSKKPRAKQIIEKLKTKKPPN